MPATVQVTSDPTQIPASLLWMLVPSYGYPIHIGSVMGIVGVAQYGGYYTRHQSVDGNPKSTTALDESVTSTLFPTTSGQMLNLKMSAGAISKLTAYPVFNMANEQVKDNHADNILLTAQYKAYEDILRYNNKKTGRVGAIASTGNATTNLAKYKHMKPIGSPSNRSSKKRSKGSKDGMGIVKESLV